MKTETTHQVADSDIRNIEHRLTVIETLLRGAFTDDGLARRLHKVERKQLIMIIAFSAMLSASYGVEAVLKFI